MSTLPTTQRQQQKASDAKEPNEIGLYHHEIPRALRKAVFKAGCELVAHVTDEIIAEETHLGAGHFHVHAPVSAGPDAPDLHQASQPKQRIYMAPEGQRTACCDLPYRYPVYITLHLSCLDALLDSLRIELEIKALIIKLILKLVCHICSADHTTTNSGGAERLSERPSPGSISSRVRHADVCCLISPN